MLRFNVFDVLTKGFVFSTSPLLNASVNLPPQLSGTNSHPTTCLLYGTSKVLAVWSQLGPFRQIGGQPITDTSDPNQLNSYMRSSELAFATFNTATLTWSTAKILTNNTLYDGGAVLTPIPTTTKVVAVWGATTLIFSANDSRFDLMFSMYDSTANTWSTPTPLGINLSVQDTYAVSASPTTVVVVYAQKTAGGRSFGYIQSYNTVTSQWSNTTQHFLYDQSPLAEVKVEFASVAYRGGGDVFVISFVVDGVMQFRQWSASWLVPYMQENYPIIAISPPDHLVSQTVLLPVNSTAFNGVY